MYRYGGGGDGGGSCSLCPPGNGHFEVVMMKRWRDILSEVRFFVTCLTPDAQQLIKHTPLDARFNGQIVESSS